MKSDCPSTSKQPTEMPRETPPTQTSSSQKFDDDTVHSLEAPVQMLLLSQRKKSTKAPETRVIVDAYDNIVTRIKTHTSAFNDSGTTKSFLKPMADNRLAIVGCLRRDINRGKQDSDAERLQQRRTSTPDERGAYSESEKVRVALDSTLCLHSAIKFLSLIFATPSLQSIFAANNLGSLLDVLVDVLMEGQIRAINARKTYELVMWTFEASRLPAGILSGKADRISDALKHTLQTLAVDDDISASIVCRVLKVAQELLVHHPMVFVVPLADLVPRVLSCLSATSLDVRTQAAITLGRYAICILDLPAPALKFTAQRRLRPSHVAGTYMARQWEKYSRLSNAGQDERDVDFSQATLPELILSVSSHDDSASAWSLHERSVWTASVMCSLIILIDRDLFLQAGALRLILECATPMITSSCPVTKRLHPLVWKCATWAFSRLVTEPSEQSEEHSELTQEKVVLGMKSELRRSMGLDLVAYLRASSPKRAADSIPDSSVASRPEPEAANNTTQVLTIVSDLVGSKATEGVAILKRLVSTIGYSLSSPSESPSNVSTSDKLVERRLLDGTMLCVADRDRLKKFLIKRKKSDFSVDDIAPLSEADIAEHWDQIYSIWCEAVQTCMQGNLSVVVEDDIAFIWQSLLLVQAQLTQGHGHLTTDPHIYSLISALFVRLLALAVELPRKIVSSLRFLHRIWVVVTNVFSAPWLPRMAAEVLSEVLRIKLPPEEEAEQFSGRLCSALLYCGQPSLMQRFVEDGTFDGNVNTRRETWTLLATKLHSIPSDLQDIISLTVLPFRYWELAGDDLAAWDSLIQLAGKTSPPQPLYVLNEICKSIEAQAGIMKNPSMPHVACILLRHADLTTAGDIPIALFSMVDRLLLNLYGSDSPGYRHSYELLQTLRGIIRICPRELLPNLIGTISPGLLRWIRDESHLTPDDDYNDNVIPLYTETLAALGTLPPTVELLNDMTEFLASGFFRVPPPALGPTAFRAFWQPHYSNMTNIETICPEPLKLLLDVLFGPGSPDRGSQSLNMLRYDDGARLGSPYCGTTTPLHLHLASPTKSFVILGNEASNVMSSSLRVASRTENFIEDGTTVSIRAHLPGPLKRRRLFGDPARSNRGDHVLELQPLPHSPFVRHADVPRSSFPPSSSPVVVRASRKQDSFSETPSRFPPTVGQSNAINVNRKRPFAFPAPPGSATSLGEYFYDKVGPRLEGSEFAGTRLDFGAVMTPHNSSTGVIRAGGLDNRALPLASPFEERPSKRMRIEEESEAGTSLASRDGDSIVVGRPMEISDVIESSSGWVEMPPTQDTDIAEDQILTAWDRTKIERSNITEVLDSSSVSLGGSPPVNRRSQTAPAGSSHTTSAQPPLLRRSLTTPALSSSRHLETLRETYLTVSENVSDMQVQDLVEAQGLVSRLGWLLNEQLGKRLSGISP
ncbi:hypothetical protein NEOLEDRAFT_1243258 [Neolentinus lepideus HHB14362 ss-1]|uniref:Uncharacterized protein n=1 Tax=Neolentinus lepideus HHB14362 ss-1 TaxID=1314782 RepID=A0A165R996_9AGAM|nr:hypothetical protein NEOLEDRAFT_1243258 [Neolentinus lepideus HHB14362 ss-1]